MFGKGKGFTFLELTITLALIAISSTLVAAETRDFYIDESGVMRGYELFSDDFEASGDVWVTYDADNDNFQWERSPTHAHFGRYKYGSASLSDIHGALTPDNWLVSPEIDLTAEYGADLVWFIGAEDQDQPNEYYDVLVSTTGIAVADFTDVIHSETVQAYGPDGYNYWRRCVDLAPYIGQTIYIAFHHWNCSGYSQLLLDDVYVISYECKHNGDVNSNGYVTVGDAQLAFAIAFGLMEPTFSEECAADCNGDGWITMGDGQTIYQVSLGMTECSDPPPDPPMQFESIDIDEVYIAPGTFNCGSPETEACRENETEHPVTLTRGFYMMTTEVSRGLWADLKAGQASLPDDPSQTEFSPTDAHPCQRLTWYKTVLFANLMSIQNGLTPCYYTNAGCQTAINGTNYNDAKVYCDFTADGYRLPTESEWEYAAKAGSSGPFCCNEPNYTTSTCNVVSCSPGILPTLEQYAVFCATSGNTTSVTGSRLANSWGLFDMHGNVAEWCWDYYSIYSADASTDPSGPSYGQFRINRSNSWMDYAASCRAALRTSNIPATFHRALGFRLVRTVG